MNILFNERFANYSKKIQDTKKLVIIHKGVQNEKYKNKSLS